MSRGTEPNGSLARILRLLYEDVCADVEREGRKGGDALSMRATMIHAPSLPGVCEPAAIVVAFGTKPVANLTHAAKAVVDLATGERGVRAVVMERGTAPDKILPGPVASIAALKRAEVVLQAFLDNLDTFDAPPPGATSSDLSELRVSITAAIATQRQIAKAITRATGSTS